MIILILFSFGWSKLEVEGIAYVEDKCLKKFTKCFSMGEDCENSYE